MLDAALKYLVELSRKSADPKPLDLKDPRVVSYFIEGKYETNEVPPPARKHQVKSLDEIIRLATRFDNAEDGTAPRPVVWYDETGVSLVLDDESHRFDVIGFPLETSDVFRKVMELKNSPRPFEQRDFIRLLRVDLAGTLEPVVLLSKVRTIKFSTTADATSVKKAQVDSLGKTIRSQVETDGGDLPEEVALSVPVFKSFGLRFSVPVKCAVEVFPADGTFKLVPMPDEIERAQHDAIRRIAEKLGEGLPVTVPAYYGKP